MRKILLITRLIAEAIFGLICMAALLLFPAISRGPFPNNLIIAMLIPLGMPRRYHPGSAGFQPDPISVGGLLALAIVFLIGSVCLIDVYKKTRKLRTSHHES